MHDLFNPPGSEPPVHTIRPRDQSHFSCNPNLRTSVQNSLRRRRREQLNHMPIRIVEKKLRCAVRTRLARRVFDAQRFEMPFPCVEVVHLQGEMVATMMREHRLSAVSDDVQLLVRAEPEPRAGKRERRAWHRFEPHHLPIKPAALLDVAHVNRDVVEFPDLHFEAPGTRAAQRVNRRKISQLSWPLMATPPTPCSSNAQSASQPESVMTMTRPFPGSAVASRQPAWSRAPFSGFWLRLFITSARGFARLAESSRSRLPV